MMEEIDLYGVFLPSLLVWMVFAFVVLLLLRRVLTALGVYTYVWHRPLFDIALYVITVGVVIATARTLK
ncbi:conserved hypothetical protein; putative membrane protein [Hyphomicrobium sp. GJ21]|jgi:hypothetical protein|uniref:DUF1656 domain-containing protein n=1 Tax=Hyphomicrobium sp. GJ21 TaxID=113574 RepID=UPI000622B4E7|nr:DUF1656 domain-containing protein [Hyphomicrobium sp. GJ21]MBN9352739.1 DUF1656 domain-containing protein [Hyphomicrobium denitrificans]CEJ86062.1 conserved hypothetical protein; putative membrane protein [Hyphomicrobium sp. GJ21]